MSHLARTQVLDGSSEVADPDDPRFRVTTLNVDVAYGLPHRLSVGLRLPVEFLRFERNGAAPSEDVGLGDIQLFGAWDALAPPHGFRASAGAGLSLPTGATRPQPVEESTGAVLQLGSGTVDPLLFGRAGYRFEISLAPYVSVAARLPFHENRNGYRSGALVSYAAGVEGPTLLGRLNPDVEVELRQRTRVAQDGDALDQTGGEAVFVVPRLRLRLIDELGLDARVSIPVWERVNERQLGANYELTAGLSYRFPRFW